MQTILGAGGALGTELAKVLPKYTNRIRLVARNPEKVNMVDTLFRADLTNLQEVRAAVQDTQVAYLTVGLPYKLNVWRDQWPKIMENTITACSEEGCKLVFFDNVYTYDARSLSPMKEDHPIDPPSKKGEVRKLIADRFMTAVEKGEITGLIARAADFYGPSIENVSILTETVFKPLSEGKKASWMGRSDKVHSFTYVPDAAVATALLGNTADAYGQVWHLPTAGHPYTGRQWVEKIAETMKVPPKYRVVSKGMLSVIGIFSSMMKELAEMAYQYDRDYVFDSSKFESRFKISPTPYDDGIAHIVEADYKK